MRLKERKEVEEILIDFYDFLITPTESGEIRVDTEKHLKNRNNQSEREECEESGQNIENNIQREAFLIWGNKAPEHYKKIFHRVRVINDAGASGGR